MQNDYHRPGGFSILPLGIKNLVIINVLVFLASRTPVIGDYLNTFLPLWYFDLPPQLNFPNFIPTQLITYQFMHDTSDIMHLLFNMFTLWMFGSIVENVWGTKKFIFFYLIAGIGSGLFHLLYTWCVIHFNLHMPISSHVVGASGAVYGVMLAYAFLFPDNIVNVYFVLPIKVKYFVMMLLAFDLFLGFGEGDGIAHFAHIGGAITGLTIVLIWKARGKLWDRMR